MSTTAALLEIRDAILGFAAATRLPAVYGRREWAEADGLLSYGPDIEAIFQHAADYVQRIASGSSPAELPVEQAQPRMVINLKPARAAGINIGEVLLVCADRVIQ